MKRLAVGLIATVSMVAVSLEGWCLPVKAQWSQGQLSSTIDDLQDECKNLVKTVQIFLQTRGRWFPQPQGADMQLCYALKDLTDQVNRLDKARNNSDIMGRIQQVNTAASGVNGLLRQVGVDDSVLSQWRRMSSTIQSMNGGYNFPGSLEPSPWNPTPGWNRPDRNPWGPTLISSTYQPPNLIVASWSDGDRTVNCTSVIDSYVIDTGRRSRPAKGDEVQLLRTAYDQARSQNSGSGVPININQRGRGSFYFAGQAPIPITQVSVRSPKWSPEVEVNMSGPNGQNFSVTGILNNYNPGGFAINLQGSGMGGATGSLQATMGAFNRLSSLSGSGNIGGRPFSLQFTQ